MDHEANAGVASYATESEREEELTGFVILALPSLHRDELEALGTTSWL